MHTFYVLLLGHVGFIVCQTPPALTSKQESCLESDATCQSATDETKGHVLMQKQQRVAASISSHQLSEAGKTRSKLVKRSFTGGLATVQGADPCTADTYISSPLEEQWREHVLEWTSKSLQQEEHCKHITAEDSETWIEENRNGDFSTAMFSTLCQKGEKPQFIEPLAGLLRSPRFGCGVNSQSLDRLFDVDWLVFPDAPASRPNGKSRFYDAGGSHFGDALQFFLQTYAGHGIVFDEVYVWELRKQGADSYWAGIDKETRAFWEPRLSFYDGTGVSADNEHEHNPVSRIFKDCQPEDFCAFKLDIDTPKVEFSLVRQLLGSPEQTRSSLDEFYFEHHVKGIMSPWWGGAVNGTFADSYKLFGELRQLGVRAHSWV